MGVPQDNSEALRWLNLAAAQGFDQAKEGFKRVMQVARLQKEVEAAVATGTRVELHGLRSKKHRKLKLNGSAGVVVSVDAGHASVRLDDGRGPFLVPRENLRVL